MSSVSVIMPVYNEAATLHKIVHAVLARPEVFELIMVDDGSDDSSWEVMQQLRNEDPRIQIFQHPENKGKGASLRTGINRASGDVVLIQDADLEYDPAQYPDLLRPIEKGHADVVFGSRFLGSGAHRVLYFWHYVGNTFLTLLSNMGTNLNLTDMETCFKCFRREVIQSIEIQETRFGFEPEITAKISQIRPQLRIYEIPISYYGRTYEEGKKIGWKDGVRALWCILKYNLLHRKYRSLADQEMRSPTWKAP